MILKYPSRSSVRGLSTLELGYALLVVGIVLGMLWLKAATVYENFDLLQASRQLNLVVLAVRLMHPNDKIADNENMDIYNLPADMVGHFKGEAVVFNPWRGRLSLFTGNALWGGQDKKSDEFTIKLDGVPADACQELILRNTDRQMQALGLVAVAVSTAPDKVVPICFVQDEFCVNTVTEAPAGLVSAMCHSKNRVSVLFTFASR